MEGFKGRSRRDMSSLTRLEQRFYSKDKMCVGVGVGAQRDMAPSLVVHNVAFSASVKFISRQEGDLFSESRVVQALWGGFGGYGGEMAAGVRGGLQ